MSKGSGSLRLVMLGVGQVAWQVAELASGYELIGTTRDASKSATLESAGIKPFIIEPSNWDRRKDDLAACISGAKVLVSFPPDGQSDAMLASLCQDAEAIIYISSTSVYGNYSGIVDESTMVDEENPRSKSRLEAEKVWLKYGAIILRAPGLYGAKSGLHIRLRNESYRLPPVNTNYISRIHLKDLARIILASFAKPLLAGSVYLVGDFEPAPQIEVVQWLCKEMNLDLPALSAPDAVPVTLTANRRINALKILNELNLQLEFPSYREGYSDSLAHLEE